MPTIASCVPTSLYRILDSCHVSHPSGGSFRVRQRWVRPLFCRRFLRYFKGVQERGGAELAGTAQGRIFTQYLIEKNVFVGSCLPTTRTREPISGEDE
ncbi:hypothetical protein HPP92_006153 [Vanilla planifolia]|uniref:Uncharacterized protein n=1 Tax=Vanilla planifolia TaxID=51239 RepID=A0A835RI66_VANPL|nr:hypothetical protein HPP92_006153 [Vanilla planifolia]